MNDDFKDILLKSQTRKPGLDMTDQIMQKVYELDYQKKKQKASRRSGLNFLLLNILALLVVIILLKYNYLFTAYLNYHIPYFSQILSYVTFTVLGFGILFELDKWIRYRQVEKM